MQKELIIQHDFWHINGIRMHVATTGKGPPIILLHGFPEIWYSWRRLIPELDRDFCVIAPDLRGYGSTDITKGGYDIFNLALDVAEILNRAGGGRPVLMVGHDWGGVIGWHVAATYPSLVKAYVAVAAPHPARYIEVLRTNLRQFIRSQYTTFFQIPILPELMLSAGRGEFMVRNFKSTMVRPGAIDEQDMEMYRKEWSKRDSMRAGINYYRELARFLPRVGKFYQDHKILAPVLVVWADQDRFLTLAQAEKLDKWCEGPLQIKVIKNCGHWIAQEAPSELYEAIQDFASKYGR